MPQKVISVALKGAIEGTHLEVELPEIKKALEEGYYIKDVIPLTPNTNAFAGYTFAMALVVLEQD